MLSVIRYKKVSWLPQFVISWLSYFLYIHFESDRSEIHDSVDVFMKNGQYMLTSENAIQSWGRNYYNFAETFRQVDLPEDGSKVLVLGLGFASVVELLEKDHDKHYTYDMVDIDEVIIDLCSRFIVPKLESDVNIIQADAEGFFKNWDQTYDMIIVDLFQDNEVPFEFYHFSFIKEVISHLNPGGVFIQNLVELSREQKETNELYISSLEQVGIKVDHDTIYSSRMIIGPADKKA